MHSSARCLRGVVSVQNRVATILSLLILTMSATAHAGGGAFLPPLKVDVGSMAMSDDRGVEATGSVVFVGLNLATIYHKRTSFDVGLGYVGAFPAQTDAHVARVASGDSAMTESIPAFNGGYLELSVLAHELSHVRTWVSGRTELLRSQERTSLGVATRVSAELWSGIALRGRGGMGLGVFALGLWAEIGVRQSPLGGTVRQASVGLSGRMPLFLAGR